MLYELEKRNKDGAIMSAEKRIVIQHTDGKFYGFSVIDETAQWVINLLKYPNCDLSSNLTEDTTLNFPIGSRVYFQGIGWTEVCDDSRENIRSCIFNVYKKYSGCASNCDKMIPCRGKSFIPFNHSSDQFYILNTKTSHTSVIHTTEESARNEAERLSKKQPGDVFKVLKVVASCQSEAIIKWSEVK